MDGPTWTWDYFLVAQNQPTPADAAMGMFSPAHLGVLALLVAGTVLLIQRYRAADPTRRRQLRLTVAYTLLALELGRQLGHILAGSYTPDIAPLHICGISVFVIIIDAITTNRWTGGFLYVLAWWGALAADIFPDWANRPLLNIYTWQSFAAHTLIVGYVLMRFFAGDLTPKTRDLPHVALVITTAGIIAALANHTWGTNFWFLGTAAPGSPLEPIQSIAGPAYVPVLIALFALLTAALYAPWAIADSRRTETTDANATVRPRAVDVREK